MSSHQQSVQVGAPPLFLLFLVFLTLKLLGAITWSWWWVTAPLWAVPAVVLVIFLGTVLIFGFASLLTGRRSR